MAESDDSSYVSSDTSSSDDEDGSSDGADRDVVVPGPEDGNALFDDDGDWNGGGGGGGPGAAAAAGAAAAGAAAAAPAARIDGALGALADAAEHVREAEDVAADTVPILLRDLHPDALAMDAYILVDMRVVSDLFKSMRSASCSADLHFDADATQRQPMSVFSVTMHFDVRRRGNEARFAPLPGSSSSMRNARCPR